MTDLFESSGAVALVLVPFISSLVELVKVTSLKPAYYPHASTLIGFLVGGVLAGVYMDGSLILSGLMAGLMSSGLYDALSRK